MSHKCVVCGSTCFRPFYDRLLQCTECRHVFADLNLSDDELFRLYKRNYFFGDEYSDYMADKAVLQKNFRLRLKVLLAYLDPGRRRNLLELGSAYGFFLDIAKDYFSAVKGIDITEDGVRFSRDQLQLDVIHGDFLKHDFGDRRFDVTCLWDTLEHLKSPHLYVEKISKIMESGALLALTTGDIRSINARIKKGKWRLIHPPTHAHYFSKETLSRLLKEHGFDVIYSKNCGFFRSVENIAYNIFVLRKTMPSFYDVLKRIGITRLNVYLNLYDIMYIIARKR